MYGSLEMTNIREAKKPGNLSEDLKPEHTGVTEPKHYRLSSRMRKDPLDEDGTMEDRERSEEERWITTTDMV